MKNALLPLPCLQTRWQVDRQSYKTKSLSRVPLFRLLLGFALAITLAVHSPLYACDATVSCDKCADGSEVAGWNPENSAVSARLERFYSLDELTGKAYAANDFPSTTTLATEYLELAAVYRCNWNYGNAIHDANRYLGLVSLKAGDIDTAVLHLSNAGKSTGSPQLDSFGPELDLANELLKQGRAEAVSQYLKDIKRFWKMDQG